MRHHARKEKGTVMSNKQLHIGDFVILKKHLQGRAMPNFFQIPPQDKGELVLITLCAILAWCIVFNLI